MKYELECKEISISDNEFGCTFYHRVRRKHISINYNNEKYEIAINSNNIEFENLKIALGRIANKKGQLQIRG